MFLYDCIIRFSCYRIQMTHNPFDPLDPEKCKKEGYELIGHGFSSEVYLSPAGEVYKFSPPYTASRAKKLLERSARNISLTAKSLGKFATPTIVYVVKSSDAEEDTYHLCARQAFIDGLQIDTALSMVDLDQLRELFGLSLQMYDRTGKMPDIACIEGGFFNPFQSPNIIVRQDGSPVLVDTDFGRTQQMPGISVLWNFWMSEGVVRALAEINEARLTSFREPRYPIA